MKEIVGNLLGKIPGLRGVVLENNKLKAELKTLKEIMAYPAGHYYSPVVSIDEVIKNESRIWGSLGDNLSAIDLNEKEQLLTLEKFKEHYIVLPFTPDKKDGQRYYYNNEYYTYSDAVFLFCILLEYRPKRVIEVGSGFSSALTLDVNSTFFNRQMKCEFIEPFPDRLKSLLKESDDIVLHEKPVQEVDIKVFESLEANDILFIDSTHVSKTGSDVNFLLFEVLPRLKKGVLVHIHDIFFPFEYPKDWVINMKRSWNEAYLLRAFLSFNNSFKIIAFNSYLAKNHKQWFKENMPLCLKNTGGSIWLQKI